MESMSHSPPGPKLHRRIRGNWITDVRETDWGPLRFEFQFSDDGRLDVMGTPTSPSDDDAYKRSAEYRWDGNLLLSPALNEGRPVHVELRDGQLLVAIDGGIEFRLRTR